MAAKEASVGWENSTLWLANSTTQASKQASFELSAQYSMSAVIPLAAFIIIVMILAIGGNSMVILTIVRHKGMRTRTNMFIANLAVADILAAIFDMPVSLVTLIKGRWVFGDGFCEFNGFTVALFLLTSIHTLMYISIHKYMSITRPFSRFMTPRRIRFMIITTWLWSGGYAAAAALGWNPSIHKNGATQCGPSNPDNVAKKTHSMVNTLCNFIIPLLVMSFCYLRIFHEIRHHMQRMRDTSNMDMRNSLLQQKRIAVTLFMVLTCFLLCIAPYIGYSCSIAFFKDKIEVPLILNPVAYWFVYTNSACNPIIYAFRSPSFRQGYREIMCGKSLNYLSGGSFRSVSQPWSRSFRSSARSTVTTNESVPADAGRLSMGNTRLYRKRRSSDTSWRNVSFMASWRGYMNKARARSLDSAQSTTADNSSNQGTLHRNQCNGMSQCSHFNTIPEASVEDDPSSGATAEKIVPPAIQIQTAIPEELNEHVAHLSPSASEHYNDTATVSPVEDIEILHTDCQEEVTERDQALENNDNDDAFYDSDVEQEHKAQESSVTSRRTRRLQSRSCIFNRKDSPQMAFKQCQNQHGDKMEPIKRPRSWSDMNVKSSPEQSASTCKTNKLTKKPHPSPFLWQPSVDYLDVPRHILRKHGGHSDSNIAESSEKEESLPMTKRLTSSFRMLFRKSHEKNLDCDKRSKESSESIV